MVFLFVYLYHNKHTQTHTMQHHSNFKRGQKVTYIKYCRFKGPEHITAIIVGIFPFLTHWVLMLDNGDEIPCA